MRARRILIGFCLVGETLFAGDALSVREIGVFTSLRLPLAQHSRLYRTMATYTKSGVDLSQVNSLLREYSERCVDYYARAYGVSLALVRTVIELESAWQPGVVSSKGAMGLMQLMPSTAEHFGVTHPFFIHENIRGGVAYLAELKNLFHGDLRWSLRHTPRASGRFWVEV